MTDQLSAKDWLDQGLKTLAERGFTALKAEPLAKALGVSRGRGHRWAGDLARGGRRRTPPHDGSPA